MTDIDAVLIAAHRGNIERYRRLLRTPLTDIERSFIERRLAEERAALQQLVASRRRGPVAASHSPAPPPPSGRQPATAGLAEARA